MGQTQIYIASGKDLAPKQRLLLIESQDLHPVKDQSGLQSRFHFVTLFFLFFFFLNLKETQTKKQQRLLEWKKRYSAVFQSIYPLLFFIIFFFKDLKVVKAGMIAAFFVWLSQESCLNFFFFS